MAAVLKGKDFWTPQARLNAGQSPGRRPGRLSGGHVADLSDLKKAILLCPSCLPKFNRLKAEFVGKRNLPVVQGRCDGCDQFVPDGRLLVHHTLANNC